MKAKKLAKPRELKIRGRLVAYPWPTASGKFRAVFVGAIYEPLTPHATRRLAAWLVKAADYVEQEAKP